MYVNSEDAEGMGKGGIEHSAWGDRAEGKQKAVGMEGLTIFD